MKFKELTDAIAEETAVSKKKAHDITVYIFKSIAERLARQDSCVLNNVGKFSAHLRSIRKSRNPQTGEIIWLPEKMVPKFKTAKALDRSLNKQ